MEILSSILCEWEKEIGAIHPVLFSKTERIGDYFSIQHEKTGPHIRFSNLRTGIFAAKLWKRGHFSEGDFQAARPWRVFYPEVRADAALCQRIVAAGYNALVVDAKDSEGLELARQFDLKVILDFELPEIIKKAIPFEEGYLEKIENFLKRTLKGQAALGIVWKSPLFEHDYKLFLIEHFKLKIELFLEELRVLELSAPIFYVLPEKPQAETQFLKSHFAKLTSHAGPKTWIVFSAYDGNKGFYPESPYFQVKNNRSLPLIRIHDENIPVIQNAVEPFVFEGNSQGAVVLGRNAPENEYLGCHLDAWGAALFGVSSFEQWGRGWMQLFRAEAALADKEALGLLLRFSKAYLKLQAYCQGSFVSTADNIKMETDLLNAEIRWFEQRLQNSRKNADKYFFQELQVYIEKLKELMKNAASFSKKS